MAFDVPSANALLNAASAGFLLAGWRFIRRGKVGPHRACMAAALACSALFLGLYVAHAALHPAKLFTGEGWVRGVYFAVLVSHTVLAMALLPLAAFTVDRAFRADFARHKRLARVTFPLWMYVSVTGVVVYVMLYRLYPE